VRDAATALALKLGALPSGSAWYAGAAGWEPLAKAFVARELTKPDPDYRSLAAHLAAYSSSERHAAWIDVAQEAPTRMGRTRAYLEALHNDPDPTSVAWGWLDGDFDLMGRVEQVIGSGDAERPPPSKPSANGSVRSSMPAAPTSPRRPRRLPFPSRRRSRRPPCRPCRPHRSRSRPTKWRPSRQRPSQLAPSRQRPSRHQPSRQRPAGSGPASWRPAGTSPAGSGPAGSGPAAVVQPAAAQPAAASQLAPGRRSSDNPARRGLADRLGLVADPFRAGRRTTGLGLPRPRSSAAGRAQRGAGPRHRLSRWRLALVRAVNGWRGWVDGRRLNRRA